VLVAGDRLNISRNAEGEIILDATEINVDTNTTYSISGTTLNVGNLDVGTKLNLISSDNLLDSINLRNGNGITIQSISDSDVVFSLAQDVAPTSDVTFNDLTVTGSLTVEGAVTQVETTNLVVTDKTIIIADGVTNSENASNAGIYIGTSNINFAYNHASGAWKSTRDMDLAETKAYKINGTEVVSSTRVLNKTMPIGDIIGTLDTQSLSNKTLNSPIISQIVNTGTLYLPSPAIADTLVGRATADILTQKSIDGNDNTLTNLANSCLSNSYMTINGTQRFLGDSFTVTATDAYDDEKAQDASAAMFTTATHIGISFNYDDTTGRLAATVNETIDLTTLKTEVAAATDFADFQSRIAAL
jgi:hypothetical protein